MSRSRSRSRASAAPPRRWTARFSSLTPGALTTLPGGLTLTRASVATIETSSATWEAVGVDVARIGVRGLRIEPARTNLALYARALDLLTAYPGASITADAAAGPDGTVAADRCELSATETSNYAPVTITSGTYAVGSAWFKRGPAAVDGTAQIVHFDGVGAGATYTTGLPATAWSRIKTVAHASQSSSAGANFLLVQDNRDFTSSGGGNPPNATDHYIDGVQFEVGKYATSLIITTGSTLARSPDRLVQPRPSKLISGGRVRFYAEFYPLGAMSGESTNAVLFASDDNVARAEWASSGTLTIYDSAAGTNTCTLPSWTADQRVELWIEAGGSAVTRVVVRIDGAAASEPAITGSALGAMSYTSTLDLFHRGGSYQPGIEVAGLSASRPSWA